MDKISEMGKYILEVIEILDSKDEITVSDRYLIDRGKILLNINKHIEQK